MLAIFLIIACSCFICNGVILHAHPVRDESHSQRNTIGEVATTSPRFYNEPHRSHLLCVKAELGTTFTSWSQHHFVDVSLTYVMVLFFTHPVRGESHNQRNTTREVATMTSPTKTQSLKYFIFLVQTQKTCCIFQGRSEERRVGKEGRSRWSPYH